jgi:hypothetical protein
MIARESSQPTTAFGNYKSIPGKAIRVCAGRIAVGIMRSCG